MSSLLKTLQNFPKVADVEMPTDFEIMKEISEKAFKECLGRNPYAPRLCSSARLASSQLPNRRS